MKQEQLEFMKPVKRKEERERKEEGEGGVGRREKEERGKEKMSRLRISQPESLLKPQESTEMSPECDHHRSS